MYIYDFYIDTKWFFANAHNKKFYNDVDGTAKKFVAFTSLKHENMKIKLWFWTKCLTEL